MLFRVSCCTYSQIFQWQLLCIFLAIPTEVLPAVGLQDRSHEGGRTPRWRGITLLHELRQVRVGGAAWQTWCSLRRGGLTPAALQLAPQLPPPSWPPSSLLPAGPLSQAGIPVAISSDNVRDQFYAYGDLDMLEVFTQASGGWQQSSSPASRASSAAARARLGRSLKRLRCTCAPCNSAA